MVYADDVTVIMSGSSEIEVIGSILRLYEAVTGTQVNQEKSVSLHLGTWRGRFMPTASIVEHWMKVLVKLLGVWFGPGLHVDKNGMVDDH